LEGGTKASGGIWPANVQGQKLKHSGGPPWGGPKIKGPGKSPEPTRAPRSNCRGEKKSPSEKHQGDQTLGETSQKDARGRGHKTESKCQTKKKLVEARKPSTPGKKKKDRRKKKVKGGKGGNRKKNTQPPARVRTGGFYLARGRYQGENLGKTKDNRHGRLTRSWEVGKKAKKSK